MSNLERFLSDVSSWYWWLSVVVVGLLVNLASAYLKQPLDRWIERRSDSAVARKRLSSASFESEVALMVKSPGYLASVGFMEFRHRFISFAFTACAAVFLRASGNPSRKLIEMGEWTAWIQGTLLVLGLGSMALAIWAHKTASDDSSLIFAARQALRGSRAKGADEVR